MSNAVHVSTVHYKYIGWRKDLKGQKRAPIAKSIYLSQ